MADLSDVLHRIRDAAATVLYPSGVPTGPGIPLSLAGCGVKLYVGWPGADLDADLGRGIVHVSVWARPGVGRERGPYLGVQYTQASAPSMTAAVDGNTVTFAGGGEMPDMIAAVIVDGSAAYTHPIVPPQTPADVAAALAQAILVDRSATAVGGVLTVPGARLRARVVVGGTERHEVRRLEQAVQLSIWAPTAQLRDLVARLIDDAFIDAFRTLVMSDGTKATISYDGTGFDEAQRAQPLHRRDLLLTVEYSVARTQTAPPIAVGETDLQPDQGDLITRVEIQRTLFT
jgi:hypothetical protein